MRQSGRKRVLTCEHSVEVGAPSSQNHPVSSDLYVLRHYGHITQQALAVWAWKRLRGERLHLQFKWWHSEEPGTMRQQRTASPAELVHDFERLPHVPRVESDGALPLDSIVFVQSVWTKSSAPERDSTDTYT